MSTTDSPGSGKLDKSIDHQRLVSLVNSMADAVIATDEHARVVLFNGAALNILDLNNIDKGSPISDLVDITDKQGSSIDFGHYITEVKTQTASRDLRLHYGPDDMISLYTSIAPVHLGYGVDGSRGYVVMMRDITREKSLEEERDEFISVVSHELRTPIAIAEGNLSNAIYVAEQNLIEQSILDALKQSYDQVLLLSSMINDLSTLSRADRGALELEVEDINIANMLKLLEDEYRPQARAKDIELSSDCDPGLELLRSSKLYVREILQNFVTNSIKYTNEGSITISAMQKDDGVLFEVSDTGIGLSKADQERIFEKFFRSEDYRTRQNSGTGLGLYVTRKLAKLIKADISVFSRLDEGSTFTIFIPNL
ncbi:MAG: ATP-binding protein [Patescibacteria group bacterium]